MRVGFAVSSVAWLVAVACPVSAMDVRDYVAGMQSDLNGLAGLPAARAYSWSAPTVRLGYNAWHISPSDCQVEMAAGAIETRRCRFAMKVQLEKGPGTYAVTRKTTGRYRSDRKPPEVLLNSVDFCRADGADAGDSLSLAGFTGTTSMKFPGFNVIWVADFGEVRPVIWISGEVQIERESLTDGPGVLVGIFKTSPHFQMCQDQCPSIRDRDRTYEGGFGTHGPPPCPEQQTGWARTGHAPGVDCYRACLSRSDRRSAGNTTLYNEFFHRPAQGSASQAGNQREDFGLSGDDGEAHEQLMDKLNGLR